MRSFVNAEMIAQRLCFPRRDGQEMLPLLVEKLITASLPRENLKEIRFPHGAAVYLHGSDGVLAVDDGISHPFCPNGLSLWEMGTEAPPRSKANRDFLKAEDKLAVAFPNIKPQVRPNMATYVCVTSAFFQDHEKWIEEKKKESSWKAIKVLDAVGLAKWLEQCPAVLLWFAKECGLPAEGLFDAEQYLEELGMQFGAPVTSDLIIGGRQNKVDGFCSFLKDKGDFSIAGESIEEAAAFVASVFLNKKEELGEISPLVLANHQANLTLLATHNTNLTLLPLDTEAAIRAKSLKQPDWRIVMPAVSGKEKDEKGETIVLDGVKRADIEKLLMEALGLHEHKARKICRDSKGSLIALLWLIGSGPSGTPRWASRKDATTHASLMLLGSWIGTNKNDTSVVESLSQKAYRDVETLLQSALLPEGPWIHRGVEWSCASKEFVWSQLAPKITETMLADFHEIASAVLSESDPSLELEPSERRMASILGKVRIYSSKLRQGIAESLARLAITRADGPNWVDAIIRKLLEPNQPEPVQRWLSLVDVYAELAEASPDVFLSCLDEFLASHAKSLFQDSETADFVFGPTSAHVYLLWALERLAWNKKWFPRVLGLLAKLAEADPGGNTGNRPINTLQTILLPWSPQHGEDLSKTIETLDMLNRASKKVAWKVCIGLLPSGRGVTSPTQKPEYRDVQEKQPLTVREYWEFIKAVVTRLLQWVGSDATKLAELVTAYPQLRRGWDEVGQMITDALKAIDKAKLSDEEKVTIEASLRQIISHHKDYEEAEWSISKEDIQTLEQLREDFLPIDPILRFKHLFSWNPNVYEAPMEPHAEGWDDWLSEQQDIAVKTIFKNKGLEGVLLLAKTVEVPGQVGRAIAAIDLDPKISIQFLQDTCSAPPEQSSNNTLQCARAYAWAKYAEEGLCWLNKVLEDGDANWTLEQQANLALGVPPSPELWQTIEKWDQEAQLLYWKNVGFRLNCIQYWPTYLKKWQEVQRPWSSLEMLADVVSGRRQDDDFPKPAVDQVMNVLEQVVSVGTEVEPARRNGQMVAYHVEKLFEYIDNNSPNPERLASLEWGWLRVLQDTKRGVRVLQQEVTSSPKLFVELLKILYRAEGEEREEAPDKSKKIIGEQAFHLLHELDRIPGQDKTGNINGKELLEWIIESRKLASQEKRLAVCDSHIGQLLSYSPESPDGTWPCKAIREILEEVQSSELENGFYIGKRNQRGVTSRSMTEGGKQEWELAEKFKAYAEKVRIESPRTAGVLESIAHGYEQQARREDERAEWIEYE